MHQGGAGEVADGDESTADVLGSGVSAQVDDDTQAGNDEQPEEELEPPAKKPKVVDDLNETPHDS